MAKFCKKCGTELEENATVCPNCGEAVETEPKAEPEETPDAAPAVVEETPDAAPVKKPRKKRQPKVAVAERISDNITLDTDGKYRWRYDLNLLKNPTIFFLVWKIFFFIILGGFTIMFFASLGAKNFFWDGFLENAKIFAIVLGVMTGISILGYLVYAAMMGGKYCVEFEMDEKGINHKQIPDQAKKAKKLARATIFTGVATGRFSAIGAGIAASRTEMYSEFDKARKVKSYPRRGLIKVNERFSHNQVYVFKEDFDFVNNYIVSHCENLINKNK